jgi:glutamyl-tRNA reductase
MRILLLSTNHRTAPVELRERLAIGGPRLEQAIDQLRAEFPKSEAVVLSTCNRTELYLARPADAAPSASEAVLFLARFCAVDAEHLSAATIHRENEQAVSHLFRVATGLDSMVLGEPQVLGQVKRAYELATSRGAVGAVLHRVFQRAIAVSKQVRSATGIDAGRVSVGSVAADFARQIFERFDDKTVLGIGTGEMAKLTLRHLQALGPRRLWVTGRCFDRTLALTEHLRLGAPASGARPYEDMDEMIVQADIILTSTASAEPIVTRQRLDPLLRRRRSRPLFVIDVAVPRNVEPAVGNLKNVYLYNIDDLQRVVDQNHGQRSRQVQQCEAMLLEAVHACMQDLRNRDLGHLIRALRQRLHELGEAETHRTLRKLRAAQLDDLPLLLKEAIESHTHRLINKVLHVPLSQLDRQESEVSLGFHAAALRRLFDLPDDPTIWPVGQPASVESPEPQPPQERAGPTVPAASHPRVGTGVR